MKLKLNKRKSWSDEGGVSEVVGNILILMITVVLFTSIIAFVNQIPVPEQQMKASFDATLVFTDGGADLTVTHASGDALKARDTMMIVEKNLTLSSYKLSEDPDFPYDRWVVGGEWTKLLTDVSTSTKVSVTIFDLARGMPVWTSEVSGGSGGNPPSILQRYADADPITPSVDPVKRGDNFTLAVKIVDLDNDLDISKIWIDSSQIEGAGSTQRPYDDSGGGWFYWEFIVWDGQELKYNVSDIDGAVIMIHAEDLAGHASESGFVLSVFRLPSDLFITEIEVPVAVGEAGLPAYLTWISGRQGFGVYGELFEGSFPLDIANVSDNRTLFEKGEMVFVRVASLDMDNIFGENRVVFTDTRTGVAYTPQFKSSSTIPFYRYSAAGGTASVFECRFNTSSLMPSAYTMSIYLMSSTGVAFVTHQIITIWEVGSPIPFTPAIWVYSDAALTVPGGTKSDPFVADGEKCRVYVGVKVQNAVTPPSPTAAEVRISDMIGDRQLYGPLPSGAMISSATVHNSTAYVFSIDLRINNGDQWLGGRNSYTLSISKFLDENEGVYLLSKQIMITASFQKADFMAGTTGVYSSKGGVVNFITPEYLYYVQNNNFFTKTVLSDYAHAPSTTPDYVTTALALGDIDGDGDLDAIIGQYESFALVYFENTLNTYGTWQAGSIIDRLSADAGSIIEWIACGDVDGDGDVDFVTSSGDTKETTHRVALYNNSYGAQPSLLYTFASTDGGLRKVDLKDMNNDGCADLIVLAEGRIWIFDIKAGMTLLSKFPSDVADPFEGSNNGIVDFDVEDMNGDGWNDVLTVGDAGIIIGSLYDVRGVWANYYAPSPTPVIKRLAQVFTADEGRVTTALDPALTYTNNNDYLVIRENTSAEPDPQGSVIAEMRFEQLDTSPYDQDLYIRAQTNPGSESFYASYSVDGLYYSMMFQISGTTEQNYSFRLPPSVAGKQIYLRIQDSNNQEGSSNPTDYIYIDEVGVMTRSYGNYVTQRYQYTTDNTFRCVRGGNLDNDAHLDVAYAKDGSWVAVDESKNPLWSGSDSYFYVKARHVDPLQTDIYRGIAPTLFDLVDINGDGLDDIMWANSSAEYSKEGYSVYKFGAFINLHPSVWCITIKNLYAGMVDERGSITVLVAADFTPSE